MLLGFRAFGYGIYFVPKGTKTYQPWYCSTGSMFLKGLETKVDFEYCVTKLRDLLFDKVG